MAESIKSMEIDDILKKIGEFGKFQIFVEAAMCISVMPTAMAVLLPFFTHYNPAWKCVDTSDICRLNGTFTSSSNQYKARCKMPRSEWQFTEPKDYSVVTQFDLYCEKEFYALLATSMVFVAWAAGAIIIGWVADKFGRRLVLMPCIYAVIIVGFISAYSPSFAFYAIARVLCGLLLGCIAQIFVYMSELVGPTYRPLAGITLWIATTIGFALVGVIAYYVRKWKMLIIFCTAPFTFTLFFIKFIPESIRWLRLRGLNTKALKVLRTIAKVNGKELPTDITIAEVKTTERGNIIDLFKTRKMAVKSIVLGYSWMVVCMAYYGVSFAADDLGGSMYRDYIISCLVEIPAIILAIYSCQKIGRKKTVILPLVIGGLSCIAVSIIPAESGPNRIRTKWTVLRVVTGALGKFCLSVSFDSMYTWSCELYPTVIRAEGMGYLQITARMGAALAPWTAKWLSGIHIILPFSLMGGSAILAAMLLMKMSETANIATIETFADLNDDINDEKELKNLEMEEMLMLKDKDARV